MIVTKVSVNDSKLVKKFLETNVSETFRYFETRDIDVLKNHFVTLIGIVGGNPVAYGHIDIENENYWLGICVHQLEQGKRYGNEMMTVLLRLSASIPRIQLSVDKTNTRAIRLYEKFAFQVYQEDEKRYFMKLCRPVPLYTPDLEKYKKSALDAIDTNWISNHGVYVEKATQKLKEIFSIQYPICMCNGTAATHCLFLALKKFHPDVKKIYVPNNVYIAAVNAALMVYPLESLEVLKIDEETWNLSFEDLNLMEKDSALLIVHNLGGIVDVERIAKLRPDLVLLEDNCEGLFGKYPENGKMIYSGTSSYSLCSSVSFYGNKTLTTGEGGAFFTQHEDVYNYIKRVYSQGLSDKRYVHNVLAYNYRMTNIEAAFLYDQLSDFESILKKKEVVFEKYRIGLETLLSSGKVVLQKQDGTQRANWLFAVRFPENQKTQDEIFDFFGNYGIEVRPFFYPLNAHEHLAKIRMPEDPISLALNSQVVMFPSFPTLPFSTIEFICKIISKYCS